MVSSESSMKSILQFHMGEATYLHFLPHLEDSLGPSLAASGISSLKIRTLCGSFGGHLGMSLEDYSMQNQ